MNAELQKVEDWLRSKGESPKSYADLSKNNKGQPLVADSTIEAYDYDSVIRSFYSLQTVERCCSCDALLLKERLYFIEFKTPGKGVDFFDQTIANISNKKKGQAWHIFCSVESKLSESLYSLGKWILSPLEVDETTFEKHAIVVYSSSQNAASARSATQASASGQPQSSNMHQRFMVRDLNGDPVFYHNVQTIPNNLFSSIVQTLC